MSQRRDNTMGSECVELRSGSAVDNCCETYHFKLSEGLKGITTQLWEKCYVLPHISRRDLIAAS
jgi:hypothetical protein